ncbi:MAG: hypothetical protein H6722_07635 [Sandaracinus sp.]|nr:hypothetical protein [Sandaracinus sp.]MCB9612309.1 hypothetical protein [Sandaracinus sp.]
MSFASYALAQLAAALRFSSDSPRVRQWRDVLEGLSSGRLTVGSRTPVGGTPAWVTLEVAHGGFATGKYRAGGPLLPHERAWLSALDAPADESARQSLNQHFLSDAGRQALREMLDTGDYRVDVPEEAALLVVTWLLDRGAHAEAAMLVETILPFADRLRFYPRPAARVDDGGDRVHLRSAHEVATSLREVRAQAQVLAMNEALSVWAPLADRAVALWLERVVGERPRLVDGRAIGTLDDEVDEEWLARVRAFLADDAAARARARCTKHLREKSTYHRLHAGLATRVRRPLDEGERARVLHALAGRLDKHGAPNDEAHRVRRAAERAHASRPTHRAIGALVAARIEASGEPDDGRPELDAALGPVCANEVVAPVPRSIVDKAQRCLSAPLPTLIARGVLRSGEMLAMVSPQRTARVSARHFGAAAGDARLEALYRRVQLAFARRRSLLLLDLQHQTRLRELPWIAALHRTIGAKSDEVFARAARDVLRELAGLHVTTYPQTILPNPLVAELRNLASSAGLDLPFTEEIAADIFMGTFSAKFAKAAQRASEQLHGSLYARYYDVDARALGSMHATKTRWGVPTFPAYDALCRVRAELAGPCSSYVVTNGRMLEQSQILTTHGLALVTGDLGVEVDAAALAWRAFEDVRRRMARTLPAGGIALRNVKNAAYAWRQMLFFLSATDEATQRAFVARMWEAERDAPSRASFLPALVGLEAIVRGERFTTDGRTSDGGRRFLGWSAGPHWALG